MIAHHPSEAVLAAYAAGSLPQAVALVAATHLGQCPACHALLATLEATGGALLDDLSPASLSADAINRVLGRLDEPARPPAPVLNPDLPPPLNRVAFGRWWPIARGIRYRPLRTSGAARGGLLLAQPGRAVPRHGHTGLELACVLSGAFVDGEGQYATGDVSEPAADHDPPPRAIGIQPCLCIIAHQGLRLHGLRGWAQRLIRR